MLQKFMKKYYSPLKLTPVIILLIFIIMIGLLYSTAKDGETSHQYLNVLEQEQKEKEWENLESVIQHAYDITKLESKILALKIEHELRGKFVDMSQLKEQFENKQFSMDFHNTLRSHIIRDRTDSALTPSISVVGTEEYIISTFSPSKTHRMQQINSKKPVLWEELYLSDPNPKLTKQAVEAVLNRSSELIYTQHRTTSGDIKTMSLDSLKKQFMENGLSSIEEISIIAPAYITEQGDIFGAPDRAFLQKQKNHKLVIVQYVPLQKIIKDRYPSIKANETAFEIVRTSVESDNQKKMTITIIVCIVLMLLALYQMAVYNTENH